MSFLMWPLLFGLAGVSIPVVIHLLHRQQARPVPWGAMQFLRSSPTRLRRKKTIEQWLLMALRMLAIAVMTVALARPRWAATAAAPGALADAPADVAVVLDHSLSTGRTSNGRTVFDRGVSLVEQIINRLKPGDTFSLVLAGHTPRPLNLLPTRVSDQGAIDQVRRQLSEQTQGMTDCSIPDAVASARRLIESGPNIAKQIIVISDHQRSNWHVKDYALWGAARGDPSRKFTAMPSVYTLPIAPDADVANISVGALSIEPTIVGIAHSVQIDTTVSNTESKPAGPFSLHLIVDGRETDSKAVAQLPPKASTTGRFDLEHGFAQAGSHWLKVTADALDSLAADNQAVAVVNVLPRLPVLIVDSQLSRAGDFKASRFLSAAMQPDPSSLIQPRVVSVSEAVTIPLDEFMAVILNDVSDLPQSLRDRLAESVRAGHGAWIILGPQTRQPQLYEALADGDLLRLDSPAISHAPQAPLGVEITDPTNPMVTLIAADRRNALVGAAVRSWWRLRPLDADARVVMTNTAGDPLVIERPVGANRGLIVLWTTSADGQWNNWNLMPNFVPLVNETVYHLAASQRKGLENRGLEAGQPIEWAGPPQPAVQSVQLTLPDNSIVSRPATFNNGRWIVTYADTFVPGIYRMTFSPAEVRPVNYAVNIDRAELDPTPLERQDIEWLRQQGMLDAARPVISAADLPAILRPRGTAIELWKWLGAVLLATLLAETFVAWRLVRDQRSIDVAGSALPQAQMAA